MRSDLVKMTGLPKQTIYSIFNAKRDNNDIRADTLSKIAAALDTDIDYLLTGKERGLNDIKEMFSPMKFGDIEIKPGATLDENIVFWDEQIASYKSLIEMAQDRKRQLLYLKEKDSPK